MSSTAALPIVFDLLSAFRASHIRISPPYRTDRLGNGSASTSADGCCTVLGSPCPSYPLRGTIRSPNSACHTHGSAGQPSRVTALEALTAFCYRERQRRFRTKVGPSKVKPNLFAFVVYIPAFRSERQARLSHHPVVLGVLFYDDETSTAVNLITVLDMLKAEMLRRFPPHSRTLSLPSYIRLAIIRLVLDYQHELPEVHSLYSTREGSSS